jgi:hypothetical protein
MASVRKDVAEGHKRRQHDPTIDNDTVDAFQDMFRAWLAQQRQANHDASAFELRAKQQQAPVGQRIADLRANFNSLYIRLPHAVKSTARKHNF